MSLLKEVIKQADTNELIESAAGGATSAGAVAGFRSTIGSDRKKTRMQRRAIPTPISFEQEEDSDTDWNKEVSDFQKRAEKDDDQDRPSRLQRLSRRRGPSRSTNPFSVSFEQEEDSEKEDWNKEVSEFRKRAKKNKGESSRSSRLTSRRRMGGPTSGTFSLSFESIVLGENTTEDDFDPSDVVSKLRAATEKASSEDNTTGFALEDTDGQIVKVYVAAEEAEEFERALGAALSGEDEDDDHQNTSLEIAEVLFDLKDKFTIVDVVWPAIDGDPEEEEGDDLDASVETDVEGDEGDVDMEGDEDDMEAALSDEDGDGEPDDMAGEEDDIKSALASVIDLLKSQADAQKAEANAKEAEANAEEAKHNAAAAESKMKQEEEVLDMEAYYADQKKAEKEAKKLKDLAKWKHETAQSADKELDDVTVSKTEVDVDMGEEEEEKIHGSIPGEEIPGNVFEPGVDENRNRRMSPGEFIRYIMQHQRGQ